MKEVQRKKPGATNPKLLFGGLVALIAVAVATLLILRKGAGPVIAPGLFDDQRPQIEVLFSAELDELQSFTIKPYNGEAYTVEREGDQFRLQSQPNAPIDQGSAQHMAQSLLHFTALSNYGELEQTGLHDHDVGIDDNALSASVLLKDGRRFGVQVGNMIPADIPQYYLMVAGKPLLYGVDTDMRYALDRSAANLRRLPNINFAPDLLDSFRVDAAGEAFVLSRVTEELWEIDMPSHMPANLAAVKELLHKLKDLRFASFVADADAASLVRYGLDQPRLKVAFHLAPSRISSHDDQGRIQQTIDVEAQVVQLEIGHPLLGTGFYCRYQDGIYMASDLSMGFLQKAQPELYVGRSLDIPLSLVNELRFSLPGHDAIIIQLSLTEQVLPNNELSRDQQGNPLYRYHAVMDGKEIAAEPVAQLYGDLMQLGGFRLLDKSYVPNADSLLLALDIRFAAGRERRIAFHRYDALHAAVLVNDQPFYYLEIAGLKPLIDQLAGGTLDNAPAQT